MDDIPLQNQTFLLDQLNLFSTRSHAPFSHQQASAICVLSNGDWVPGVRVESASWSLTIPALLNAYTTTRASNREDLSLVCLSRSLQRSDLAYLGSLGHGEPRQISEYACIFDHAPPATLSAVPLDPFLAAPAFDTPEEGIRLVRTLTERAHIPESNFPVACLLESEEGQLIPGVNVEHSDWLHILCAERNALGTAQTYGIYAIRQIYLTCKKDLQCSPCGACRQLLAELTPEAVLWMDRGLDNRESTTPSSLLPEWFTGSTLKINTTDC